MQNPLALRLKSLPPAERNQAIARIWSAFRETDEWWLLQLILGDAEEATWAMLAAPGVSDGARTMYAGGLKVYHDLRRLIQLEDLVFEALEGPGDQESTGTDLDMCDAFSPSLSSKEPN